MKRLLSTLAASILLCCFAGNLKAQQPLLHFAKSTGGPESEISYDLEVDNNGNIYTTGHFSGTADFDPGTGVHNLTSQGGTDIFILKLSGTGEFIWAKSIGSAGEDVGLDLVIEQTGNVYVTGYFSGAADFDTGSGIMQMVSEGNNDAFVLKLNSAGGLVWAKKIGSPSDERSFAITLDFQNNVCIAGNFYSTVDCDPNAGVSNLTSAGMSDIFVVKLTSAGNYVWAKKMGGPDSDLPYAIATDPMGNIYTTGEFHGPNPADFNPGAGVFNLTTNIRDVFVSKLNVNGEFVWAKNTSGGSGLYGNGITIDPSGNVLVIGFFSEPSVDFDPGPGVFTVTSLGFYDIFILKLNSGGDFLWAKSMGGQGADFGNDITTDLKGNVYTTGGFQAGFANEDFDPGAGVFSIGQSGPNVFISKLDSLGDFVWAVGLGGTSYPDEGRAIKVDASGNIYTTGEFGAVADFDPGAGIFNLTSAGNLDLFVHKMQQPVLARPEEFAEIQLAVFPNPATYVINLVADVNLSGEMYSLYNFLGRNVAEGIITPSYGIDIQGLPAGLYFLKINGFDNSCIKFVKE